MWKILLFEVVILILAVAIWLLAPFVGITQVWLRVLIILALVLPPIIYLVIKTILSRRAAKGLEDGLKQQASAHQAANPEELALLTEKFEEAITALKGRGKDALYEMPWYMIVGPPAAGKSTALLRSGLNFPFTSGGQRSIKGVGGTRNCDWWFTEEAILLDTAGRYTSEEEDYEEYVEFLRLLKRYRKKRPLNGLIVCLAVSDLLNASPDQVAEVADRIRARVDQVISELEMIIPVYILFSKCDLLGGFVEFFGDLGREQRDQVLGFTMPLSRPKTDIEARFHQEFDLIAAAIRERMVTRMATADVMERGGVYNFPLEFERARGSLSVFLKRLFAFNPFKETPRLRGVYFCSGTQEGRPMSRVLESMAGAMGVGAALAETGEDAKAKKSYFIKDLFTKVIFPDRLIAGFTASGHSRRWRIRLALMIVLILGALTVVSGSVLTFTRNRGLVKDSLSLAKNTKPVLGADARRIRKSWEDLERLGRKVEDLRKWQDEHPFSYGLGYYTGDDLIKPLEAVFATRAWRTFGDVASIELEASVIHIQDETWKGTPEEADLGYQLLRTYLMMADPKRLDIELALPIIKDQWYKRIPPELQGDRESDALMVSLTRRYLTLRKKQLSQARWKELDQALVDRVRRKLLGADVLYKRIIQHQEDQLDPFTLRVNIPELTSQIWMESGKDVPGVFTKEGFDRVSDLVSKAEGEGWILWDDPKVKPSEKLLERYFDKYSDSWVAFLNGISIKPVKRDQVAALLTDLTGSDSLYLHLLKSLSQQVDFRPKGDDSVNKMAQRNRKLNTLMKTAQATGLDKKLNRAVDGLHRSNSVEDTFKALREWVDPPKKKDGTAPPSYLSQYLAELGRIKDEIAKITPDNPSTKDFETAVLTARLKTDNLLQPVKPEAVQKALRKLLEAPLDMVKVSVVGGAVEGEQSKFLSDVCPAFQKVQSFYPFNTNAQEGAAFADVAALFAPDQGKVWTFFNERLKDFLEIVGENQVKPKAGKEFSGSVLGFYNNALAVKNALFPLGSTQVKFDFRVVPDVARVSDPTLYQVSEIRLEVDGTVMTYRNGPRDPIAFTWPGKDNPAARLVVRGNNNLGETVEREGEWGLLRLLEDASKRKVKGRSVFVEWSLKEGKIVIPMEFKVTSTESPVTLLKRLKQGMTCP